MVGVDKRYYPTYLTDEEVEKEMARFDRWCTRMERKHQFEDRLVAIFESQAALIIAGVLTILCTAGVFGLCIRALILFG